MTTPKNEEDSLRTLDGLDPQAIAMRNLAQAADIPFPTRWANFRLLAFEQEIAATPGQTALALVLGDIHKAVPLVRIHSQCSTGDIFNSLRCDCHDQLHLALESIVREGAGVLVYEHQEGRGIGLIQKLKAYALQDEGLDTVEANLELGYPADLRDYRLPAKILLQLGLHAVRLMTNNPGKVRALIDSGVDVVERVSADVPLTLYSRGYARTKQEKMGHYCGPVPPGNSTAAGSIDSSQSA